MTAAATTLPYRPCAGVMLLNPAGLVFAGQRLDSPSPAWQMPQGGLKPDEDPEDAAHLVVANDGGGAVTKNTAGACEAKDAALYGWPASNTYQFATDGLVQFSISPSTA